MNSFHEEGTKANLREDPVDEDSLRPGTPNLSDQTQEYLSAIVRIRLGLQPRLPISSSESLRIQQKQTESLVDRQFMVA